MRRRQTAVTERRFNIRLSGGDGDGAAAAAAAGDRGWKSPALMPATGPSAAAKRTKCQEKEKQENTDGYEVAMDDGT